MIEYEGTDSVMEETPFAESEEIEGEPAELTSTPLKKYVTIVRNRKEGNACKWICNFECRSEPYTGTYSRIRAHLIGLLPGQKSQGVALCPKVNKEDREEMKKEEAEAKRAFGGSTHRVPIPNIPVASPLYKASLSIKTEHVSRDEFDLGMEFSSDQVDEVVARFFYGNGIPLDVVDSSFWADMVKTINEAPKGYKSPSAEKMMTTLLDKEKTKVEQALMPLKQQWPTYGVSIVLDGWRNFKNNPILNVMAVSEGKAVFITGIYCSGEEQSSEYIAELLIKAIEIVGEFNVIQVLTDNASPCKSAGEIIESKYPRIFWSACIAHTLSLLINDVVGSRDPILEFVGDCYRRASIIVKFIQEHDSAMHMFQTFSTFDFIQAGTTKLGHHFAVLEHVLHVKNTLISMALSEEWEKLEISGSKSNIEREEVRRTILDDEFWKKVKTILAFLKPIWGMIRFCDNNKAFIGEIYQRMEDMFRCIKGSLLDNAELCNVINDIVMARWAETNLSLYSLAYVLTPYYYSESWLTSLAPSGEKRGKPHANPDVYKTYLDALERLAKDAKEAHLARQQLSDFVSNKGVFACRQSIEDRGTMSAISWWNLYGVTANELYCLAVKVLSQCVSTSCVERTSSTCGYIDSVRRNKMNAHYSESLLYVHCNHMLLARQEKYEGTYRNWDSFVDDDDDLENDMKDIAEREYCAFHEDQVSHSVPLPLSSCIPTHLSSQAPAQESINLTQAESGQETPVSKRPRTG